MLDGFTSGVRFWRCVSTECQLGGYRQQDRLDVALTPASAVNVTGIQN